MSVTSIAARPSVLSSATEALAAARAYAASIADGVIGRDRAGGVPYAELAALDASGLLGITVPAAHGGPDLSPLVLAEVIATIAATDPAIAQIPQAHFLFVDVLAVHGTAEQQERLFADVLAGARLGNGLAERGGQHAQDLKTRLRSGPGGLRLDGRKYYCTGAISARWIGVSALDDGGRLVLSFVGRNAPGLQLADDWDVMGQRATVSGSDLSRHWRNARTHASHDPVDWKYHHVGNFLLNHAPPPNHGQV
jgi:alkylation response protein AidB-like acyl-CoA dehydrogenase